MSDRLFATIYIVGSFYLTLAFLGFVSLFFYVSWPIALFFSPLFILIAFGGFHAWRAMIMTFIKNDILWHKR
jgi:hypothetical protein